MIFPTPAGTQKSNIMILSVWLVIQLTVFLTLASGCVVQQVQVADTKIKNQVSGVVKNIIPLGTGMRGRCPFFIEFDDGRIVNICIDPDSGVFLIHKNKYNTIYFDDDNEITNISVVEAEVNFP